jgi:hypothetical protein
MRSITRLVTDGGSSGPLRGLHGAVPQCAVRRARPAAIEERRVHGARPQAASIRRGSGGRRRSASRASRSWPRRRQTRTHWRAPSVPRPHGVVSGVLAPTRFPVESSRVRAATRDHAAPAGCPLTVGARWAAFGPALGSAAARSSPRRRCGAARHRRQDRSGAAAPDRARAHRRSARRLRAPRSPAAVGSGDPTGSVERWDLAETVGRSPRSCRCPPIRAAPRVHRAGVIGRVRLHVLPSFRIRAVCRCGHGRSAAPPSHRAIADRVSRWAKPGAGARASLWPGLTGVRRP